jgi:hypothetical protein
LKYYIIKAGFLTRETIPTHLKFVQKFDNYRITENLRNHLGYELIPASSQNVIFMAAYITGTG